MSEKAREIYDMFRMELKRRRELTINEAPEVIRRDSNNQFGVINRQYLDSLNHIDREIYLHWKWVEL